MSDEYIKKLSQIKADIGLVQDSVFFELHKLDEVNEKQSELLTLYKRKSEIADELAGFYGDATNWYGFPHISSIDRKDLNIIKFTYVTNKESEDRSCGGKLARQKLAELKILDEKIKELE